MPGGRPYRHDPLSRPLAHHLGAAICTQDDAAQAGQLRKAQAGVEKQLLTGIAAFFGALMNMSFLLCGSASTNPVLLSLAIGLILACRVAGYYGVDRYLLPQLGAPWRPGALFLRHQAQPESG